MRYGTIVGFQNPETWRVPWEVLYADTLEFVELAEEFGLDEIWLTEHHFAEDGYCPSLLPVAAAIASRTKRMRIGTKATLLPLHDPVRLAEDAAVVDIISGGRLDLGVAAGYRPAEFSGFGLNLSDRAGLMSEGLDVLCAALSGEPFEHSGRFHTYGHARIMPPPVQQPLPLWMGGRSAAAMRRAAHRGFNLMLADFIFENTEADCAAYLDTLREERGDASGFEIAAVAVVFVDEDPERAWAFVEPHLLYQQNQYQRWFTEVSDRATDSFETALSRDELRAGAFFVGDPESVATSIVQFRRRVPFTHFSFWTLLPGLSPQIAGDSLRLFVERVIPRVTELDSNFARPSA